MATETTNGIYKVNGLLFESFDPYFNTITFGDPQNVNLQKQDILPLVHVMIINVENGEAGKTINYDITMLDVVDNNNLDPRESLNNYHLTENVEDILHDLDQRFTKAWYYFRLQLSEVPESVTLSVIPTLLETGNKLTGYDFSFSVTIPQNNMC